MKCAHKAFHFKMKFSFNLRTTSLRKIKFYFNLRTMSLRGVVEIWRNTRKINENEKIRSEPCLCVSASEATYVHVLRNDSKRRRRRRRRGWNKTEFQKSQRKWANQYLIFTHKSDLQIWLTSLTYKSGLQVWLTSLT